MLKIHCKYDELVAEHKLIPSPKNANKHSQEQIERLSKLIQYQGIRAPVVVSKRSGFIVKGHGTTAAIRKAGGTEIPVVYQDFETDDQELAYLVSDNSISEWSELDLSMINAMVADFGPDFEIQNLGLQDFEIEIADKETGPVEDNSEALTKCPSCGHEWSE